MKTNNQITSEVAEVKSGASLAAAHGSAAVPMPSVQKAKMSHLVERGGHVVSLCLLMKSCDGKTCTIDDFGHVEWQQPNVRISDPAP